MKKRVFVLHLAVCHPGQERERVTVTVDAKYTKDAMEQAQALFPGATLRLDWAECPDDKPGRDWNWGAILFWVSIIAGILGALSGGGASGGDICLDNGWRC